MYWLFGIDGD